MLVQREGQTTNVMFLFARRPGKLKLFSFLILSMFIAWYLITQTDTYKPAKDLKSNPKEEKSDFVIKLIQSNGEQKDVNDLGEKPGE